MAKERFERPRSHPNVGRIGHIDYERTTLMTTITNSFSFRPFCLTVIRASEKNDANQWNADKALHH